ncbi:MAG TPA: helix-turn-helix transcriptional regulator [Solirubrobacteraceae bacterium]|jgi:DNA-binding XRE family transcriptional regulator|nr:helix-turn-helix transcriptional regulator [Solirubrobacteraceae bacterium]
MVKLSDMKTSEQVLAEEMNDPAFRAEWQRTTMARALALKVLAYRTEQHLSQRALAAKLDITQPQVARIEAGEHNPTIDTLARIAQTLDIEFAIDVRPCEQEPKFVNKRAQARDAVASYVSGGATVLFAAG